MPIYAYKCSACGFAKDQLQKMSDPPLTVCPECGQETFSKQVTAAGFQFKGSGWYVTDFRNNGSSPKGTSANAVASGDQASVQSSASEAKPVASGSGDAGASAPAPASKPGTASGGSGSSGTPTP